MIEAGVPSLVWGWRTVLVPAFWSTVGCERSCERFKAFPLSGELLRHQACTRRFRVKNKRSTHHGGSWRKLFQLLVHVCHTMIPKTNYSIQSVFPLSGLLNLVRDGVLFLLLFKQEGILPNITDRPDQGYQTKG